MLFCVKKSDNILFIILFTSYASFLVYVLYGAVVLIQVIKPNESQAAIHINDTVSQQKHQLIESLVQSIILLLDHKYSSI